MNSYLEFLFKGEIEEAEKIRIQNSPNKIIKFVSLTDDKQLNESKFKALHENQIWFSPPKKLNDPFEFKWMVIDKRKLAENGYSENTVAYLEQQLNNVTKRISISSFTSNECDNIAMWSYYSNNHKGYCVEYDIIDPKKIYEVFYESERIKIASIFVNFIKNVNNQSEASKLYFEIFKHQFLLKHISWKHEKEYRIIVSDEISKGGLCSLSDLGLKVSKITAGINCSDKNLERLQKISYKLSCYPTRRFEMV